MYRQSDEPRFVKKKEALQRAFIDLTLEKRSTRITVKELAEQAGVNRMTFYSHYDEVSDVLAEFIDELAVRIMASAQESGEKEIGALLNSATNAMQEEIDFYRLVAREEGFELYRATFRKAFEAIFVEELKESTDLVGAELALVAGMVASGVTYAYLDWLAGRHHELLLEELVALCEQFAMNMQGMKA